MQNLQNLKDLKDIRYKPLKTRHENATRIRLKNIKTETSTMFSWKNICNNPDFCPIMVKNTWTYCSDISTSTVIDTDAQGNTLLHLAVFGLLVREVSKLISLGSDVNATNSYGYKPHQMLLSVIGLSNPRCEETKTKVKEILKMLIDHGAVDTPVFQGIDEEPMYTFAEIAEHSIFKKKAEALGVMDMIRTLEVVR